MADTGYLDWPFLDARHRELAAALDAWAGANLSHAHGADVDDECRRLVREPGPSGAPAFRG